MRSDRQGSRRRQVRTCSFSGQPWHTRTQTALCAAADRFRKVNLCTSSSWASHSCTSSAGPLSHFRTKDRALLAQVVYGSSFNTGKAAGDLQPDSLHHRWGSHQPAYSSFWILGVPACSAGQKGQEVPYRVGSIQSQNTYQKRLLSICATSYTGCQTVTSHCFTPATTWSHTMSLTCCMDTIHCL